MLNGYRCPLIRKAILPSEGDHDAPTDQGCACIAALSHLALTMVADKRVSAMRRYCDYYYVCYGWDGDYCYDVGVEESCECMTMACRGRRSREAAAAGF